MAFGELQADELQRFGSPRPNRLVVDAYMAQHPGDGADRRERQSVFVHLVSLGAVLDAGLEDIRAIEIVRELVKRKDFPALQRSGGPGDVTLLHMAGAPHLAEYERRARAWADAVWASWNSHHQLILKALAVAASSNR